jgi:hypothetical protein
VGVSHIIVPVGSDVFGVVAVAGKQDDETSRDPREIAGLCKAIPKHNLGDLLHRRRGMVAEFADAMGVNSKYPSKWVSGDKRMTNEQVAKASWLLGVHPLYLLDMTGDQRIYASLNKNKTDMRKKSVVNLSSARRSMEEAIRIKDDANEQLHDSLREYVYLGDDICTDYTEMMTNSIEITESNHLMAVSGFANNRGGMMVAPLYVDIEANKPGRFEKSLCDSLITLHGDYRRPDDLLHAILDYALANAADAALTHALDVLASLCGDGNTDDDGTANTAWADSDDHSHGRAPEAEEMLKARARLASD